MQICKYDFFLPPDIGGLNARIYLLLFQRSHFKKPYILHSFLHFQLNTKLQKSHPNAVSQNSPHKMKKTLHCADDFTNYCSGWNQGSQLVVLDTTLTY